MIECIYIEDEIKDHPRTLSILDRFDSTRRIKIKRYGDVFNKKSQNFRLQKSNPALILARKHQGLVLDAPDSFGIRPSLKVSVIREGAETLAFAAGVEDTSLGCA